MPLAWSLRKPPESLRSLPDTVWPMAASTLAIALMPAPPTPTMWIRRGRERSSTSATGVRFDQLGDVVGGVEMRLGPHCRRHRLAARRVVEDRTQLGFEPRRRELAVRHPNRRPRRRQHLRVGGLVVTRRDRERYEHGGY